MGIFESVSTIDTDVMNCYGLTLRGLPEDIEKVKKSCLLEAYELCEKTEADGTIRIDVLKRKSGYAFGRYVEKDIVKKILEEYTELKAAVFVQKNIWGSPYMFVAYSESGANIFTHSENIGELSRDDEYPPFANTDVIGNMKESYKISDSRVGFEETVLADYEFPYKLMWDAFEYTKNEHSEK